MIAERFPEFDSFSYFYPVFLHVYLLSAVSFLFRWISHLVLVASSLI